MRSLRLTVRLHPSCLTRLATRARSGYAVPDVLFAAFDAIEVPLGHPIHDAEQILRGCFGVMRARLWYRLIARQVRLGSRDGHRVIVMVPEMAKWGVLR
ncbi:Uncharacterised protein [Mycobacterium tuberculosis]|nr:Uncharacterised protein [Mycobacterium tuberculosis]